jgi:hypothetical protein
MPSDSEPHAHPAPTEHREEPGELARESSTSGSDAPLGPRRCNELLLSFVAFALIAFGVWVVSGGKRYREEYAAATQGWRVGTTRVVELTVVREDKTNLACASDHAIAGLRCGHGRDQRPVGSLSADKPEMLQPYSTVGGELLLGAGLWTSPDMKQTLPSGRFSVVCNYTIKGVMKSARIRFDPASSFNGMGKTVTVGSLTDCVLPR